MSFWKKVCSIVLAAAMILTIFACITYIGVNAEEAPQIVFGKVKVAAGGTAEVTVSLNSASTDIYGFSFEASVDTEKLTYTDTETDLPDGASSLVYLDEDVLKGIVYSDSVIANGDLLTLKFTTPQAVNGSESFDIAITDVKSTTFASDNTATVAADSEDGEVTAVLYGDVNADGTVEMLDCYYLQRHFAHWGGYTEEDICMDAADINADGTVEMLDCYYLQRHFAHWIGYETLPYVQSQED